MNLAPGSSPQLPAASHSSISAIGKTVDSAAKAPKALAGDEELVAAEAKAAAAAPAAEQQEDSSEPATPRYGVLAGGSGLNSPFIDTPSTSLADAGDGHIASEWGLWGGGVGGKGRKEEQGRVCAIPWWSGPVVHTAQETCAGRKRHSNAKFAYLVPRLAVYKQVLICVHFFLCSLTQVRNGRAWAAPRYRSERRPACPQPCRCRYCRCYPCPAPSSLPTASRPSQLPPRLRTPLLQPHPSSRRPAALAVAATSRPRLQIQPQSRLHLLQLRRRHRPSALRLQQQLAAVPLPPPLPAAVARLCDWCYCRVAPPLPRVPAPHWWLIGARRAAVAIPCHRRRHGRRRCRWHTSFDTRHRQAPPLVAMLALQRVQVRVLLPSRHTLLRSSCSRHSCCRHSCSLSRQVWRCARWCRRRRHGPTVQAVPGSPPPTPSAAPPSPALPAHNPCTPTHLLLTRPPAPLPPARVTPPLLLPTLPLHSSRSVRSSSSAAAPARRRRLLSQPRPRNRPHLHPRLPASQPHHSPQILPLSGPPPAPRQLQGHPQGCRCSRCLRRRRCHGRRLPSPGAPRLPPAAASAASV